MEIKLNSMIHGFLLKEKETIKDIHADAYLFEHIKSGARLFYIKSSDSNKVFSISFKTPPEDDCGTPHILEHSVLCGSRKYTSKDPFNELAKGSLNTFLNAFTYGDKTMYPIASCNEEDFHNLMDVYLDAVFYPNIYIKKEIFMQEGWRYLIHEETGELDVTGVVYNEMKGALSDPESLLQGAISRSLFGKTTYGFESGGTPEAIPDLTYENFLSFHEKYYHPSNSYIYLYGDMDLERCLIHIGNEYLNQFVRTGDLPEIKETKEKSIQKIQHETFPTDSDDETGYLAYSVNVGLCTDEELTMAMQVLSYILLETNASVLKTALMDGKICDETEGWFDSSAYEMVFSIVAKNAAVSKVEDFEKIIEQTLQNIINDGLDQELLSSSLRRLSFLLKEEDYGSTPKGLIYGMKSMKSWLHGKRPFQCLRHFEALEKIKNPNYDWKSIIEDRILLNEHKNILVFSPDKNKENMMQEAFQQKMKEKKVSFNQKELERIHDETKKLELFQHTKDAPEVLAQIPILKLSQIDTNPPISVYEKSRVGEGSQIFVPMQSNGIIYLKLHFDTDCLSEELLPYAGLLTDVLGKLDTKKYAYQELPLIINKVFGGFSFQNDVYSKNTEAYHSFLTMKSKFLKEDINEAVALAKEILLNTNFEALDSLRKIVRAAKIKGENYLTNYSHSVGIYYSVGRISRGGRIKEITSGIEYFHFLTEVDELLSKEPEKVLEKLKETVNVLFSKRNFNISFGCEKNNVENAITFRDELLECLDLGLENCHENYNFVSNPVSTAFTANSGVLYNILAADFKRSGFSYSGKMQVLKTILNLEYLWNEVRVKGGAYGSGCNFQPNGICYFYSYRDPNIKETYKIYETLWKMLGNFSASDREMTKYILGTINRLDQPKTNIERLNDAINKEYQGYEQDFELIERNQVIQTTKKDILEFKELLQAVTSSKNYCTIGNEGKINVNSDFFDSIQKLIP
ncbi:peptidase M16C associated [Anaerotignum neopropionicum]|uniref:Peptidase M16C associated n=1 Tax=Anaerotignum neopropionicum TaxID=36847 RepID=A0A136WF83_9FIRM|nr:insulinase family protein [Anaerotignum neopropionicum]KXL53206.1 peptidase M16C associated [Anaerotignum neopropionicum]